MQTCGGGCGSFGDVVEGADVAGEPHSNPSLFGIVGYHVWTDCDQCRVFLWVGFLVREVEDFRFVDVEMEAAFVGLCLHFVSG